MKYDKSLNRRQGTSHSGSNLKFMCTCTEERPCSHERQNDILTCEAIKVSKEITQVLNEFHDIDIAERSIIVTKLFPIFMKSFNIENPLRMNYRESVAWQKGWDKGFEAGKESEKDEKEYKHRCGCITKEVDGEIVFIKTCSAIKSKSHFTWIAIAHPMEKKK